MIHSIRTSKFSKIIASYLAIQLILTSVQPTNLYALTGGPSQPEFNSFTPIGTSDMVNLSSGDFNYNIPIMDVGGYPLNLAYDSGISMDQEASWVGLGWNLNVGQINRQVRGLPDDFRGDLMTYENNLKDNKTVGLTLSINGQISGNENITGSASASATLMHNNYDGFSFTPSFGISYKFASGTSVGMNLTPSVNDGVTLTPSASQSFNKKDKDTKDNADDGISHSVGFGVPFNSRQGITSFNINTSTSKKSNDTYKKHSNKGETISDSYGGSSSLSFVDNTFTPSKRNSYKNDNYSFSASLGPDFWPVSAEFGVSAFASSQKLIEEEKIKSEKSYGYEFTEKGTYNDILDFNRENERTISKNTLSLPVTNYTYDIYSIQGQGIGGQFRPHRSQVGYLYSSSVEDSGDSFSLGAEVEAATGFHGGVDIRYSPTESRTGVWDLPVLSKFKPATNTKVDYEPTYFKSVGDMSVDDDRALFSDVNTNDGVDQNNVGGESPIALDLEGGSYGKKAVSRFNTKRYGSNNEIINTTIPITNFLKRNHREKRNQAILKITKAEANLDPFVNVNSKLSAHHTNGLKVLQPDGSTYIYGEAVANTQKNEVSFATNQNPNLNEGTIPRISSEDSRYNSSGIDHFYSKTSTPTYAHTYLLSSVLSSDYEDLTGNGPSDDDLGAYTKFYYNNFINDEENNSGQKITGVTDNYNWRVPYETNKASYNPGLYTKGNDEKGSYVSGTKELKYATMIETKTHIAIFDFDRRLDGKSAGNASSHQLHVSKIKLYSRPEAIAANLLDNDPNNNQDISPIKTVHFEYDYSLMKNTPNGNPNDDYGRLTLKKLYFTYRDSNMGKYTPYVFNYENPNPDYQIKSYDVWANYKPLTEDLITFNDTNADGIYDDFETAIPNNNQLNCEIDFPTTAQEFPFVKQNKEEQDLFVSAWTLSSVDLPSGGKLELKYESDDYQYVQDRAAMQMFNVVGVSDNKNSFGLHPNQLYGIGQTGKYLIVELTENVVNEFEFEEKYLGEYVDKPLFFRFLLNMEKNSNCSYDYVEGYCNIDRSAQFGVFNGDGNTQYGAIPIKLVDLEGGVSGNSDVNPIAKSGWYFARQSLNRYAYGQGDDNPGNLNLQEIVNAIGGWLPLMSEIFRGPNGYLKTRGIAKKFKPEKSFIRLKHPSKAKLGGGLRVKKILMHDNWDVMVNNPQSDMVNPYSNFYGQEYSYQLDNDNGSSGVASWEPNMSKENPFIEPFYNNGERLIAPKEMNYVEKPFGQSFFPGAGVTYSRVTVKNLDRQDGDKIVKNNATGEVVSEFFTTKNFPTITDHTNLEDPNNYKTNQANILDNLLNLDVKTEFVLSQGFNVITNDMNGKSKSQKVYNENGMLISGVDYIYSENNGRLNNNLPVVLEDGTTDYRNIGTHYDVITDFNENYNLSETYGVNTNITFFIIPVVIPIPVLLGQLPYSQKKNETILRTTTTTKVIHKAGILKEKIAYDLGATVSTRNIAWDAVSGQVLLTETTNEYNDNYYNFSYPAHWAYNGMGQAVHNLGLNAWIEKAPITLQDAADVGDTDYPALDGYHAADPSGSAWNQFRDFSTPNLRNYLSEGDEVYLYNAENGLPYKHLWISEIHANNRKFILVDRYGTIQKPCGDNNDRWMRVVRSHKRNLQSGTMASVTSQSNPIQYDNGNNMITNVNITDGFNYDGNTGINPKIINASAITYDNFWRPQRESNLKTYPQDIALNDQTHSVNYPNYTTNPYNNNILGDWRAIKSYAYLTQRSTGNSTRNSGFYKDFIPLYKYENNKWIVDNDAQENKWTFASEVTKYSPFGAELENADALGRYSSAQYGYGYTLPTAVASNSEYRELGFDGFEDYRSYGSNLHFSFKSSQYGDLQNGSGAFRTSEEAHTGKYSIKVSPGEKISLKKEFEENGKCLDPTNPSTLQNDLCEEPEYDCPCGGVFPDCDSCGCPSVASNHPISSNDTNEFSYAYLFGANVQTVFMTNECVMGNDMDQGSECISYNLDPVNSKLVIDTNGCPPNSFGDQSYVYVNLCFTVTYPDGTGCSYIISFCTTC
ncbi:hypothetical protein [Psychroserpens algicola]|uniref:RHS repeat-associated core domain-containing protein n=1 Tax=Psychroserpens algicola TaxID=1719034 RepID=A0ABT0HDH0_9FLAO|nr:hypothetical protein [Psychroserpens algicola]MCK8482232.1 hypothetical protein [Psychroserpens algicola]